MPNWNPSGTPICTTFNAEGGGPLNDLVRVCPDGSGGAFVAWTDSRNTPPMSVLVYDVFAQHLLADGRLDPAWPAQGLALTGGSGYKYPHALTADGSGGFWLVCENPGATYLLRVTQHASNGSAVGTWTTPSYATQYVPDAVSDGAGGLFVTWHDCRDCLAGSNAIDAMRLVPGAIPSFGWPSGGVSVVAATQSLSSPVITETGDGAAMVAWLASEGGGSDRYAAQRVESNGLIPLGWPAGGRTFATSTSGLFGRPLIVRDGAGGALFAFRRNTPNLFGSRVTSSGNVPAAFPDTGLSLCTSSGDQFLVSLVSDGVNGAYVLWEDRRDDPPNHSDVYATRFTREGEVGSTTSVSPPPPHPSSSRITLSLPAPNPTFGSCTFRLSLSAGTRVRVDVLDLSGRAVATLLEGFAPAGAIDLHWDGHDRDRRTLSPGIYLLRARAGHESVTRRIARLE